MNSITNIGPFIELMIVGSALSYLISYIKIKYGTDGIKTKGLTILLALAIGTAYYFLSKSIWWESILGVLASASTFYAFFLKK